MVRNYMEGMGKPIEFEDGEMFAQGEEATDRWKLVVKDNCAKELKIAVTGRCVECPECGNEFLIDLETEE